MKTQPSHSKLSGIITAFMMTTALMAGLLISACSIFQSKEVRIIDAIQSGNNTTAEQLIQEEADLNYINESGTFALMEAASTGNLELTKLLVTKGADINLFNKSKTTALMEAVKKGHKPVVAWLVQNKAELSLTNNQNYSAIHIAVDLGRRDIIEILLSQGVPTGYTGKDSISFLTPAIINDDIETVRFLLDKNVNPNATSNRMTPPLIIAAKFSNPEILKLLLDRGADIHAKNADGRDALSSIGGLDQISIIEKIYTGLDSPIDSPNTGDGDAGGMEKIFHFKKAQYELQLINIEDKAGIKTKIKLLYDNGFLTVKTSDQALQSTAEKLEDNYISSINLLLDRGADINTTDKIKRSVLMLLCNQEDTNFVSIFKSCGAQMEPEIKHQLDLALRKSGEIQNALIQVLIGAGVDVNLQDRFGQSPLMAACSNNHVDFADILVNNGSNVNQTNYDGWTPLINATSMGNFDLVELLLLNGANVHAANNYGETPLLKAVYRNNEKIVKLLLEYGADPHRANKTGDSPLSVAKNKGYAKLIPLLAD